MYMNWGVGVEPQPHPGNSNPGWQARSISPIVCLSVAFVHRAQTAELSYRHDVRCIGRYYVVMLSLSVCVRIWLTSIYPFLSKFCPKVTHRFQR